MPNNANRADASSQPLLLLVSVAMMAQIVANRASKGTFWRRDVLCSG
jgi:hypothetical protein